MKKKNVLSLTKAKKDVSTIYTLRVDGRYLCHSFSETFIVHTAMDYYFKNDIYLLDDTLSDIIGDAILVFMNRLQALPYNEETI